MLFDASAVNIFFFFFHYVILKKKITENIFEFCGTKISKFQNITQTWRHFLWVF